MALLICSLLMGLQSVPGIIKPYSKGVVQFLTKVPEKQKSKDSTRRQRLLRAARVRPPRCRELPVLVDEL